MLFRSTFTVATFIVCLVSAASAQGSEPSPGYLKAIVERLASDKFEGRRTGEPGGYRSFDYLRDEMRQLGLVDDRFLAEHGLKSEQVFDVTRGIKVVGEPRLQLAGAQPLALGTDYVIAPFSGEGTATDVPLVFAGYGIIAPDLGWNDYKDLEVNGAIVVIVRGEPQADDPDSVFSGDQPSTYADLRRKASTARDLGAAGLLILNNPLTDASDELPAAIPTYSAANFDVPALHVKRDKLDLLIKAGAGHDLRTLLEAMDRYGSPASTVLNQTASLSIDVERDLVPGRNLIGVIPGCDPALAGEYIVIGAHYDHLGRGGTESLAPQQFGEIHYGADDNASGVGAALMLGALLARSEQTPRRTVLICLFDAEEIGTVGSKYVVDALPEGSVHAMLNFDMVGKLRSDKLIVGGTATADEFRPLLDKLNDVHEFDLVADSTGFGASDHIHFIQRGVPSLFFFTGAHEDYHKPSDTADKVNYDGAWRIVEYARNLLLRIDEFEDLPFRPIEAPQAPTRNRGKLSVTLGTVPSYVENGGPAGMAVGDVVPGGPAQKAGIKGGDVIVRIGEKKVSNIYDFMYALEGRSAGEVIEVEVLREEEQLVFNVTLAARNVQE
jgi:Zn-dependent M28 family amino/carboxypeptidase